MPYLVLGFKLTTMRDYKTILNFMADIYISAKPNFFYSEVVYFCSQNQGLQPFPLLSLSDIFVDQIDIKLIEEQSDGPNLMSSACFFFKS